MAFVFYDTETTGLETGFDQILQFAAIKTDDNLKEIASINLRARILPHVVPSPGALVTTRVHPSMLIDTKYKTHYSAIREIREKLLSWSPAIFAGYNSISYDEELFRQALFQTLHSPYITNTNGSIRADVMKMAQATAVYAPDVLVVPTNGKETFRLEPLATANGFAHKDAHDALADVRATIYVANLIKEGAPKIWDAMLENASKAKATKLIQNSHQIAWTERYGSKNFCWIVTACGNNPDNSGQIAVFDLASNPDEFIGLGVDALIKLLGAKKKIIRSIRANAQPIVMPAHMAPETAEAIEIPIEERERRVAVIATNPEFQKRVGEALARRFEGQPEPIHLEEMIYQGFANADEQAMLAFHSMDWAKRHGHAAQFQDKRVAEFSRRLLYFEHPDGMEEQQRIAMQNWVADRCLTTEEVPWTTIAKAQLAAAEMLKSADSEAALLLKDTQDYLADMEHRLKGK